MTSNPINSKFTWLLVLVAGLFLSFPIWAAESVGSFQFVHGTVSIERNSDQLEAKRGDDIFAGDTLKTEAASSAQITMVDGARMALRPRSELVIDEYVFNDDEDDTSLVSLTKGGLRTVTGALGRSRPEKVKIDTPVATMGIRGTDMDTFFTPDPQTSSPEDTEAVLRVNKGTGVISSAGVELDVPAGTIAAAAMGQPPRAIPSLPPSAESLEAESTTSTQDDDEDVTNDDAPIEDEAAEDDFAGDDDVTGGESLAMDDLISDEQLENLLPSLENLGLSEEDFSSTLDTGGTTIKIQ
ncbi:FecR family protein [Marinospirillum sp.]|uniref:FecR family protein n=1 Tax=Marinospirillum sp. TaxID=2183934 RepID=UPI0028705EE3|nr:FecR family protein [Marinospirillum sp.]MDR9468502.1 FecR family protein [Marinospirillum sp.]